MHTTEQLNTALAGSYAIERKIGSGGMAVVYLARDLRHNRQVALKVLNPELGAVLGPERFMAEIQVTATLHHPNLLPLFDSGEAGGLLFYAMPYIEGETLRQRLTRERQLSVDDAVRITVAIAGALDYAHRHGVIHRDLKPENILMHEGQPLVMDFGIALAVSKAGGQRITQTGLSLGTPQYMSPEQATGDHAIDARSDIYSLGAVCYEMLVGDPPHTGSTMQAVIAKVITEQPRSVRATRPTVPEHVEAALMTALAKLPADRFATAADFAATLSGQRSVALASSSRSSTLVGVTKRPRLREFVAWGVAAVALVAALWPRAPKTTPAVLGRFSIAMPDTIGISGGANGMRLAMSRDGSQFALIASPDQFVGAFDRAVLLWNAGGLTGQLVRGSEGATSLSFSPDGRWLLFVVQPNRLMKVAVGGGTPVTLVANKANEKSLTNASWGDDNRIVYNVGRELWSVAADGGDQRRVAVPDTARGMLSLTLPEVLPGATHALVTVWRFDVGITDSAQLGIVSLKDGSVRELGMQGFAAHYAATGHIVFSRSGYPVYAAPFSLKRLAFTGSAVRVLDVVGRGTGFSADVAVAQNGWMIYSTPNDQDVSELAVVDHAGKERLLKADARQYADPALSPDGKRLVVRVSTGLFYDGDLWIYELGSGALSRFTSNGSSYRPRWSTDGSRILYMSGSPSDLRIVSRPWDGSGAESVLVARPQLAEIAPGPPGGYTAIRTLGARDIWLARTESLPAMRPFVTGLANETNPAISPDGHWLAYSSDETQRVEIYVRPVPGPGGRIPVSVGGGTQPHWSRDSKTIFYRGPTHLMAATLSSQSPATVVRRDSLFADNYGRVGDGVRFDVFPSGREFLFLKSHGKPRSNLYLVVNWQQLVAASPASRETK